MARKEEIMSDTNEKTTSKKAFTVKELAFIGVFTAIIAVCSWISIPATVPFTLQTFAVFLAIGILGGRNGSISVLVYVLLGAIGVPVFANFSGGLGALLGSTGGYIVGFIASALIMWLFEKILGHKLWVLAISSVIGLIACYALGTVWFMTVYTKANGAVGIGTVLGWCVIPYIIPDLAKIAVAVGISSKLRKIVINL